jgi:hypothetical protein
MFLPSFSYTLLLRSGNYVANSPHELQPILLAKQPPQFFEELRRECHVYQIGIRLRMGGDPH